MMVLAPQIATSAAHQASTETVVTLIISYSGLQRHDTMLLLVPSTAWSHSLAA
jgi:hypothetical protein